MSEPETETREKRRITWSMSRQRLIELAVVVFGVLIALALDSLAEEIRLRGDARELEKGFQEDIGQAVQQSWERQLINPCLKQTLASLARQATDPDGQWEAAPTFTTSNLPFALPPPYRAPVRIWTTASFDRALGTEAFKRIPFERADAYAVLFAQIEARRDDNAAEYLAVSRLAPLAVPQTGVDVEVRAELLQALSQLDRHRGLAFVSSEQIIAQALSIPGVDRLASELLNHRVQMGRMGEQARLGYGDCVDLGATDRLLDLAAAS